MTRKYIESDYSKFPFITIRYSSITPTVEEFDEYLIEMEEIYDKYTNFVLIFDATKTRYLSSELRFKQSNWIRKNADVIKSNCLGLVYILPNIGMEIIFKCIIKFSPLPVKFASCSSVESSIQEAAKFLEQVNSK